ncbi:MAG: flagella basal body P-ring formation protein FlgA [Proteobacteria bacterium]|nr:flagella basal body P-ring formation protein FlgA [Pseudomonadota bacterium]MCP4921726.1 flagella basal body P-ring formation protein FlgA [Pseudomonadota bacterium]
MFLFLLATASASSEGHSSASAALVAWAMEECGAVQVELHRLGLASSVEFDPAAHFSFRGDPCRRRPTVKLHVVEPSTEWSVTVEPTLEIWVEAPVASETTDAGEIVVTRRGIVPALELHGEPLEGEWMARTRIEAGSPVTDSVARAVPDARRGASVVVQTCRGALCVNAPGRLVEDGVVGASIRVVNQATLVTLTGTLIDSNTVEIP